MGSYQSARGEGEVMNRRDAFRVMFSGKIVRGTDPIYLRKEDHGGWYLFRYNFERDCFERKCWQEAEWVRMGRMIYLFDNFEIVYE